MKSEKIISGAAAAVLLIMSFAVPKFSTQFLVPGTVFLYYFLCNCHGDDLTETKKMIEEHNKLLKQDIDLLKEEKDSAAMN